MQQVALHLVPATTHSLQRGGGGVRGVALEERQQQASGLALVRGVRGGWVRGSWSGWSGWDVHAEVQWMNLHLTEIRGQWGQQIPLWEEGAGRSICSSTGIGGNSCCGGSGGGREAYVTTVFAVEDVELFLWGEEEVVI